MEGDRNRRSGETMARWLFNTARRHGTHRVTYWTSSSRQSCWLTCSTIIRKPVEQEQGSSFATSSFGRWARNWPVWFTGRRISFRDEFLHQQYLRGDDWRENEIHPLRLKLQVVYNHTKLCTTTNEYKHTSVHVKIKMTEGITMQVFGAMLEEASLLL